MDTSIIGMLAMSLLILAATKECVGELKHNHDQKITTAMTQVSNVLGCFSSVIQRQNNDVLTSLSTLPDSIENKLKAHEEKIIDTLKKEMAKRTENEELIRKNEDLERRLEDALKKEEKFIRKNEDLEEKLGDALKKAEFQTRRVEEANVLTQQLTIRKLLEEYNTTKEWGHLRRDLETVLDRNSPAYNQLQNYKYDDDEPLWHIGKDGNLELVTVLVVGGRGATVSDKNLRTLLHGAAYGDQLQQVEMLLDHGADIEAKAGPYDKSPLAYAASSKHSGALKLLLRRGADIESTDHNNATVLHSAAANGNKDGARILVEAGANTAARTYDGKTALDMAVQEEDAEIQQYLSQLPH